MTRQKRNNNFKHLTDAKYTSRILGYIIMNAILGKPVHFVGKGSYLRPTILHVCYAMTIMVHTTNKING